MKGQSFYLLMALIAVFHSTTSKLIVEKPAPVSFQCFTRCLCERTSSLSWHVGVRCRDKNILSIPRNLSSYTTEIDFARNKISFLRRDAFALTRLVEKIQLEDNEITELPDTVFKYLLSLQHLSLARNKIKFLPERVFIGLYQLNFLDLGRNELAVLPNMTFVHLRNLKTLGLQGNKIKELSQIVFRGLYNLQILFLNDNLLTEIPPKVFDELTNLETLFLSRNKLTSVRNENFIAMQKLYLLLLNGNKINFIHERAFANLSSLYYLFLNDNELESILDTFFMDADSIRIMTLSNNPVKNMTLRAFGSTKLDKLFMLNIHLKHFRVTGTVTSARETKLYVSYHCTPPEIVLRNTSQHYKFLTDAFAFGGFHCNHSFRVCKPCDYGTYMVTSRDGHKCVPCPPGGFFQNSVGHHGNFSFGIGCKSCSRGTYVKPYKNPGKDPSHCKVCPSGTKSNEAAGFRACKCLDGFHRFYRFGGCGKCPRFGVDCSGEYMALLSGYYWIWDDLKKKTEYEDFSRNLDIDDDSYDRRTVWFNGSIPKHHPCLSKYPCRGGVSASCATGHNGVLCEVCKKGYYKTVFNCKKCPSVRTIAIKIFIVITAIFVASVVLKIRAHRRREPGARSPIDAFVSKVKIIVSFYHLTPCMLESFPYIEWPYPMSIIGEYAKLDVLQFIPPQCIIPNLRFTAFHKMMTFITVNVLVILLGWIVYKLRIRCIPRRTHPDKKRVKQQSIKENICRYVYLFLFFTFPSTCLSVVRLFPANCHYLCADNENTRCAWYLKADFRVICFEKEYNRYIGLAYFCLLYPITVGTLGVLVLWRTYKRNRLYILAIKKIKEGDDDGGDCGDSDADDSDDNDHHDDCDDDWDDLKKLKLNLEITDRGGSKNKRQSTEKKKKNVQDEDGLGDDPGKKLQKDYDQMKFKDETFHPAKKLSSEAIKETISPRTYDQAEKIPKVRIIVDKPKDDHEEKDSENIDEGHENSSPENKKEEKDGKDRSFLENDGFYKVVEKIAKSPSEDKRDLDQITKSFLGNERKEKWRDVRDKTAFITALQQALLSNQAIRNKDAVHEKNIAQNLGKISKMELFAKENESKFLKFLSKSNVSSPEEIGLTFVHGDGLAKGAKFLYENYEQELWYWEIIETAWKLIITSGVVVTGKVTRSTIGISSVISGMYVVVFAFRRPISDPFDNFLHLSSLLVSFINISLGVYLKINLENADPNYDLFINSTPVVVVVACSNVVLFILLVLHYFYVCLYLRFKAWFMKTRLYKFIDDRFISPVNSAIELVKEKIQRIKRRIDKAIQNLLNRDDYVGMTCRMLKKYLDKVKERI